MGVTIIDAVRKGSALRVDYIGVLCIIAGALLLGLPPVRTARGMMRGKLKGDLLTIGVLVTSVLFTLFVMIDALCVTLKYKYILSINGLFVIFSALLFGGLLWLTIKLSTITISHSRTTEIVELKQKAESSHVQP